MLALAALDTAEKYVAGAYTVFVVLLVIYLAIMSTKVARIERQASELLELEEAAGE